MALPLDGVRVIDLTDDSAAFATRMLADLGADVVRVEPEDGGPLRRLAPFAGDGPGVEASFHHLYLNANKRSVVMDPGSADFARLAATAHVLVETVGPALPVTPSDFPHLAWVTVTPFGLDSPWSARTATDLIACAAGGLLWTSGHPDDPPTQAGADQGWKMTSLVAVTAAMVGLHAGGGHFDISAQEAVAMSVVQTSNANYWAWRRSIPKRPGLTAVHRCQDDGWVALFIGPARADAVLDWAALHDIDTEAAQAKLASGAETGAVMHPLMRALATAMPRPQFLEGAWSRDIWALPVNSLPDMAACNHFVETRQFLAVDGFEMPRSPVDCMGPDLPIRAAPRLGEHTEAVLSELPAAAEPPGPVSVDHDHPLRGIRVIDFCWVLAGPLGTRILANLGAEVIRIMPSSDRALVDFFPPGVSNPAAGALHNLLDTNKRSISVDPRTDEGRRILHDLIATADVVTENYRPGALRRMGFAYEEMAERNPGLVLLHMPGAGSTGPWSKRPTLGNMVVGAAGISFLTGFAGRPPRGLGVAYPDFTSPYLMVVSVLAALRHRAATGHGREIDLSQLSATVSFIGVDWMAFRHSGLEPPPRANRDPNYCPHGVFPTRGDDEWVAIACQDDASWHALCTVMGAPDIARRWSTLADRKAAEDEVDAVVAEWTLGRERFELADALQAAGVAAAAVESVADALERDPNLPRHFQRIRRPEAPDVDILVDGEAVRFAGHERRLRPAPVRGADTEDVLRSVLGLSEQDICELAEKGIT
jgi:crotonobetainyl-CoA:carnitine CoA-transferase CaiB-like acyl-CoA transferase